MLQGEGTQAGGRWAVSDTHQISSEDVHLDQAVAISAPSARRARPYISLRAGGRRPRQVGCRTSSQRRPWAVSRAARVREGRGGATCTNVHDARGRHQVPRSRGTIPLPSLRGAAAAARTRSSFNGCGSNPLFVLHCEKQTSLRKKLGRGGACPSLPVETLRTGITCASHRCGLRGPCADCSGTRNGQTSAGMCMRTCSRHGLATAKAVAQLVG